MSQNIQYNMHRSQFFNIILLQYSLVVLEFLDIRCISRKFVDIPLCFVIQEYICKGQVGLVFVVVNEAGTTRWKNALGFSLCVHSLIISLVQQLSVYLYLFYHQCFLLVLFLVVAGNLIFVIISFFMFLVIF